MGPIPPLSLLANSAVPFREAVIAKQFDFWPRGMILAGN